MVKAVGPPLLPVTTEKFGELAPELLVSLVTDEVPTGLVVVQEKLMVQLLPPAAMAQVWEAGVRVPDMTAQALGANV